MQIIKLSKNSFKKELLCWLGLALYLIICQQVSGGTLPIFIYVIFYLLNFIWAYYFLFLFLYPNFFDRQKIVFSLIYLSVIVFFLFVDYMHIRIILPYVGGSHHLQTLDKRKFLHHSIISFTFVAFASLGSYLNWRSIQRVKEKLLREKNILLKELDFIKDQFNSHFTFNFFGYCYSNALQRSSQSTESIESFTQMLHYSLKNESNEYIPLTEEIMYIENFISIQRCITDSVYTEFVVKGGVETYCILPGILSTFVENSFKHGVFNQKESPIQIFISLNENVLSFVVKNKRTNKKNFDSTGVGIAEMDEVLKLFYPGKYRLEINTDNPLEYCLKLDLHLVIMTA